MVYFPAAPTAASNNSVNVLFTNINSDPHHLSEQPQRDYSESYHNSTIQGDKATAQANLLRNPLEGRINQRFKFGLNTNHQDKSVPERKYYAAGFVPNSGTLEDLN